MVNDENVPLIHGSTNLSFTRKGRLLIAALQKEQHVINNNNNTNGKDSQHLQDSFNNALKTTASSHILESSPMFASSTESEGEAQLITLSDLELENNNSPSIIEANVQVEDPRNHSTQSFMILTPLINAELNCGHSSVVQASATSEVNSNELVTESFNQADFDSDDSIRDNTFNPTTEAILATSSTTSECDDVSEQITVTNSRQKRHQRPSKRKILKAKRNKGERYETMSGKIVEERRVTALSQCRMKCREKITIQDQEILCKQLWSLGDYNKRTDYLASLILDVQKKTQRIRCIDKVPKPRAINHIYHLKLNGNMTQVCKVCFLKTFAITNKSIEVLTKKKAEKLSGILTSDKRGSSVPPNKISEENVKVIKDHINSYPIYESHYTRRHTEKKYLPAGLSIATMYDMYKVKVPNPASYGFFGKIFRSMGLSFKKPSLDTCNNCDSFNMKIKLAPLQDIENFKNQLHIHQAEADTAYAMKQSDKENCSSSKKVYSFDLQQCLATPFLQTNIVFYKRLLWTFNLTIYDCFSKKSYCYMWHEGEGGRGANQIASCLYDFILSLSSEIKEIIFYSDTCGGQNKNSHVVAMFLCLTRLRPDLRIEHKFLIPGHTHMECDTVHAQIERKKKTTGMSIHLPRDWYNLVRGTNKTICVIVMTNSKFLNFAQLYKGPFQLRKVDSCGEKFLWHDVKWFCFSGQLEAGTVKFKTVLSESESFKTISFCRRGKANELLQPQKCYDGPTPISEEKKKDLLSILHLIETDCHEFYRSLPTTGQNTIADPDLEDFNED